MKRILGAALGITFFSFGLGAPPSVEAASCVWKVTAPNGKVLFLGGSIHSLRGIDYPLPRPFNLAFDASSKIVFERQPKDLFRLSGALEKVGRYPRSDSVKNHVDPRTYAYLKRYFGLRKAPEKEWSKYKPWLLEDFIGAPGLYGLSPQLGVEGFLFQRARSTSKPVSGLESLREAVAISSDLTERQSEASLLLALILSEKAEASFNEMVSAWRKGNAEALYRDSMNDYRDYPVLVQRLLAHRNRRWIPKIEKMIQSKDTHFVVVGAAHMGGSDGVLALLKARGYRIEQL